MIPTEFCNGTNNQSTKQMQPKIAPKDLPLRSSKEKPFTRISKDGCGLISTATASCPCQSAPEVLPIASCPYQSHPEVLPTFRIKMSP